MKTPRGLAGGLPQWSSGSVSARQVGGHQFDPWSGKMLHAAEQLGPWSPATEALTSKAGAPTSMRSLRTTTREKLGQQRRLSTTEEKLVTLEKNKRGSTGLEILEILHECL